MQNLVAQGGAAKIKCNKHLILKDRENHIFLDPLLCRARDEEGRKKDPEVFREDIRLTPERLRTVVSYLESINLEDTDLDSRGRAFEAFMGSFFRGDFGQYFTPRPIVSFVVDCLPIKNDSLVLDTSCGSGGFLLHALDKVRKQANEYHDKSTAKGAVDHCNYWHNFAEKNLFGIEINQGCSVLVANLIF
uniref:N-6 DNA Methylase n=2 Tax=Candidatus Kentrum sp. LPFa TaxID=2126335 RepID=A0A450WBS4_9GAMM|nr:MAG: N-6 DNA Methylase [Candidatus Kentron sp. LPFa]